MRDEGNTMDNMHFMKTDILGVGITVAPEESILEYIFSTLQNTSKKLFIVTPNPEMIVYASKHPQFRNILNTATISLADGVGVLLAGEVLGKRMQQRITGTDFMQRLCEQSSRLGTTVGFLGGQVGIAEKTAKRLEQQYPGLQIVFTGSEWTPENKLQKNIDILFVAYGIPKQEEWIAQHLSDGHLRLAIGVGGAFDYISGKVPRAPFFIRSVGLEWLFRLIRQPWRIKRQIALLNFLVLVIKERFNL